MNTRQRAAFIINFVFYGLALAIAFLAVKYLTLYALPFLVGFTAVHILQRPMLKLSKKLHMPKNILTLLCLLLVLGALASLCAAAVWGVCRRLLCAVTDGTLAQLSSAAAEWLQSLLSLIGVEDFSSVLSEALSAACAAVAASVNSAVKALPSLLVSCVVSVAAACFMCFWYDSFIVFLKRQLSDKAVQKLRLIKRTVNDSVYKMAGGYLLLAAVTFVYMSLALFLLGVRGFFVLAALIAAVDLLPVLGTGVVLLVVYASYSVLRYFLEPRIVGARVGLNPLVSLLAMFLGLKLFGFAGIVILPISAAAANVLHKNGVLKLWK